MKLYYIINNSLKRKLKDYKSLGILILFPVMLTFIFITVFGNIGAKESTKEQEKMDIKAVIYSEEDEAFNKNYLAFLNGINQSGEMTLSSNQIMKKEEGQRLIEEKKTDMFAEIDKEGNITLYQAEDVAQQAYVFRGITESFLKSQSLDQIVIDNLVKTIKLNNQIQKSYTLKETEKPKKDYFILSIGATMIAFAILMAGSYGNNQIHYIRKAVGRRVQSAPISKITIYFGEYISGVFMAFIQGCAIALISDGFFHIGYMNNPLQIISILIALSMMSVAIGTCIGALVTNEKTGGSIISMVILILCFTSGGFNPNLNIGKIAQFSPITLINQAIIDICMRQRTAILGQTLGVTLLFTLCALVIASIKINLEAKEAH